MWKGQERKCLRWDREAEEVPQGIEPKILVLHSLYHCNTSTNTTNLGNVRVIVLWLTLFLSTTVIPWLFSTMVRCKNVSTRGQISILHSYYYPSLLMPSKTTTWYPSPPQLQALFYQPSLGERIHLVINHMEVMSHQPASFPHHEGHREKLYESFRLYDQRRKEEVSNQINGTSWDMGLLISGLVSYSFCMCACMCVSVFKSAVLYCTTTLTFSITATTSTPSRALVTSPHTSPWVRKSLIVFTSI